MTEKRKKAQKKRNRNTEYEKFVQEVYQCLHEEEGLEKIEVQHNVNIPGKSGCNHQVDVYWEFEMLGEIYRIAVECKNYKSKMAIGKVRDFFGALYDIGNIKGIMATKAGYQSGVLKFADYFNVSLKEVREPLEINLSIIPLFIEIVNRTIIPDIDWMISHGKIKRRDEQPPISVTGAEEEIGIFNNAGDKITDFYQMKCELFDKHFKEMQELKYIFQFDDGYIATREIGRIKINSIEFTYNILSVTEKVSVGGREFAKALIKDIKTGKIKLIK